MKCRSRALGMITLAVLAAASVEAQQATPPTPAETVKVIDMPRPPEEPKAPPLSADEQRAVEDGNTFSVDLYKRLDGQEGNLFFSPASIQTVLAVAYAGARGETAAEMADVLHFHLEPEKLHRAMGSLLRRISTPTNKYELGESSDLWLQSNLPLRPEFLKLVQDSYGEALEQVDFVANTETARAVINAKVESQTKGRIKELLSSGLLSSKTRLVLTNSIYFKGEWDSPFTLGETVTRDFFVTPSKSVQVPLMSRRDKFKYLDGHSFKGLEIPYKSGALSMIVFLPGDKMGLAEFERTLTPKSLTTWLGEFKEEDRPVDLMLPRFRSSLDFGLVDTLKTMGLSLAFSEHADFSGMTGAEALCISVIRHKAVIAVDEKGAEAAAGTVSVMQLTSAEIPAPVPIIFRADHPFMFLIRDNRSGSILFLGRLSDPS